ncbi:MAG: alanine racemase [Pseudomonadota bacterium]|nr:alanine racemase [Alphaproteobacteria bacterium]MEC7576452.1 alanine racemase [Pseudomonadota bacterium]MEC7701181.1 alanine racemase [Pseudomonadota bacterium]MED5422504.1 alanine racemase [Pseudomonadota bacterium]
MNIRAQIHTQNILHNYDVIARKLGKDKIIAPVVKANAYGLGAVEIVKLLEGKKPLLYYVATLDEALELRPYSKADLVVFGGLSAGQEDYFIAHNIIPALKSEEDMRLWHEAAKRLGRPLPCHIHLDTAMNRTGIRARGDSDSTFYTRGLDVRCILSHFVSSEETDNPLNQEQIDHFLSRAAQYELAYDCAIVKSMANSSAIFNFPESHFDLVRPGGALWGVEMQAGQGDDLKPALQVDVKVLQVSDIKTGQSVGYNELYRAERPQRIATLAIGYADGLHWPASNQASFYWNGQPCKIAGSVSMDLTTVILPQDLSDDDMPRAGEYMELIGDNQRIETLAQACGARAYEMQISFGNAPRIVAKYL